MARHEYGACIRRAYGVAYILTAIGVSGCATPRSPVTTIETRSANRPTEGARLCSSPRYPLDALRGDAEGTTRLLPEVSETGKVLSSKVVRSAGRTELHKELDQAAIDSFNDCPFRPAKDANGQPVKGRAMVDFEWRIEDAQK